MHPDVGFPEWQSYIKKKTKHFFKKTLSYSEWVSAWSTCDVEVCVSHLLLGEVSRTRQTPRFLLRSVPIPIPIPGLQCLSCTALKMLTEKCGKCQHRKMKCTCTTHFVSTRLCSLPARMSVQLLQNLQGTVSHWRWMPQEVVWYVCICVFYLFIFCLSERKKRKGSQQQHKVSQMQIHHSKSKAHQNGELYHLYILQLPHIFHKLRGRLPSFPAIAYRFKKKKRCEVRKKWKKSRRVSLQAGRTFSLIRK